MKMNKIYYFRLQSDEQLVVDMKTNYSRMLNNFRFPSPDGALLLGFGGKNSNWGVFTPPNASALTELILYCQKK